MDDDSGTSRAGEGHEADAPDARRARENDGPKGRGTAGRRADGSDEAKGHDTVGPRTHGTDEHDSHDTGQAQTHDTADRQTRGTDEHDSHDTTGPRTHTSGAPESHGTTSRQTHTADEAATQGTAGRQPHGTDETETHDTTDRQTHGTDEHDSHDTTSRQTHTTDEPASRGTADGRFHSPGQTRARDTADRRPRDAGQAEGHATADRHAHASGEHDNHGTASPQAHGTKNPRPDHHPAHTTPRQARWEQRTEVLLAVASLVFLVAYALRVLAQGLPKAALDLCLAVTLASWALFAVDYAVRWRLSGQRLRFVRTHVLDTVVLLLPLLRPLRVVKLYEAVQRRHGRPRLALHARVIVYAGLSTLLLGFTGALAVYQQEHHAPGTTMRTFGDAVWWTCATLATVGYGDVVPVTPLGRLIAVGVMAIGLALLGAVTGTFASWLLQVFAREDDERPPGN